MRIGFYIKWNKGSLTSRGNVIGDELFGESICKALRKFNDIEKVELYAPNYLPKERLDIMIYLNDSLPDKNWANKHILYLQNGYGEKAAYLLQELRKNEYDGYIFFSLKLLKIHQGDGYQGIFLPFGVDTEIFKPQPQDDEFTYEVAYIGNDIKGEERTMQYLYPAKDFNFGLFGNWEIPKHRFRFWKNFKTMLPYKKLFQSLSQGKIAQEKVPVLYSNAKINLNCTLQSCVDWDVITLRTYEVLACKGFLITDKVPAAVKSMKNCMVFTDGNDDLVNKIKYYLTHEEERQAIAQRGYEYVIKQASIDAVAQKLISYLKDDVL